MQKEPTLQNFKTRNHQIEQRERKRKDQSKVSFASHDIYLSRDVPSYSSDTEIGIIILVCEIMFLKNVFHYKFVT